MSSKVTITITLESYEGLTSIGAAIGAKKVLLIASDYRKGILAAIDELALDSFIQLPNWQNVKELTIEHRERKAFEASRLINAGPTTQSYKFQEFEDYKNSKEYNM